MTLGIMAKDCEIRIDYDKLRKDRLRKTNEQMKKDGIATLLVYDQDWNAVSKVLPMIERELFPYQVRPHWGKLFTIPPAVLQSRYEKLNDFKDLIAEYDSDQKFRNAFIDKYLYC